MTRSFIIGTNYWPRQTAMFWWRQFDPKPIEQDFTQLKELGLEYVRLFLLWEDFQPLPDRISDRALENLGTVANIAHQLGLRIMPTFFTGHMSGINWSPEWMVEAETASCRFPVFTGGKVVRRSVRSFYLDQTVRQAQKRLIEAVVQLLRHHPAVWAWDLGNESSNFMVPPDQGVGLAWLEEMVKEIRRHDSAHPVTIGLHMEDLEENRRLGPREGARYCDFLSMHGYPLYAAWADGPMDVALLPFLGLLTRWLGNRDVLFQEFGVPTQPVLPPALTKEDNRKLHGMRLFSEDAGAEFYRRALPLLRQFGMMGAMAWCYGDYDPALWAHPPCDVNVHERFFGLFRHDGSPKPVASVLPQFAKMKRTRVDSDLSWINVEPGAYYQQPRENIVRLYRRFKEHFLLD